MANNTEILVFNSVFKVGTVFSVDGRVVRVKVDKKKNTSHIFYKGTLIKNVAVGSYVKIMKGFLAIIGKVESEYIQSIENDKMYHSSEDDMIRLLNLKLIGYFDGTAFYRGVNELPLIDNECFLLTDEEYNLIHSFGEKNEAMIQVAHLASDTEVPIELSVNKLFSSHIGIFGNTGSGKSYTLSKLYRQLFRKYSDSDSFRDNAQFLFLDFNGEYSTPNAITSNKKVFNLSTGKNPIDRIPLTNDDLLDINMLCIFASATEKTQRPFIERCIRLYKKIGLDQEKFRNYIRSQIMKVLQIAEKTKGDLMIDYLHQILPPNLDPQTGIDVGLKADIQYHNTNSYYYWKDGVHQAFETNFRENAGYIQNTTLYRQVEKFELSDNRLSTFIAVMYMQLIYDVLNNRASNEHIAPAINKLKAAEKSIDKVFSFSENNDFWGDSNIVVVNLRNVNLDMRKMIPLLLANRLYLEHKEKNEDKKNYLNIVVDEAHNILSRQSNRESEDWKDYRLEVFEEIIKEGRKFGVFMTIASQRPSDISPTIISQLHNYFIHRLVNDKDIEQVGNTISYLDKVSIESLPILTTGNCIIAGQLVEMPVVVHIDRIEKENIPNNATIRVAEVWS